MRRKRGLTEDDRKVWRDVARTIDRQKPAPAAPESAAPKPDKPKRKQAAAQTPITPFRVGEKSKPHHAPAVTEAPQRTSPNLDRRTFQRLVKGQMDIDTVLDLHGMTADQAKSALIVSLRAAHARGERTVLVITGKGRHARPDEFNRMVSGTLRKNLPDWLRGPSLSGIVLQVSKAQQKHGGAGAFYVYLRRKR